MTTCHGCNRPLEPLAATRTYHAGCDPKGRVEMLERALKTIAQFPIPEQDDMLSANMREIARAALEYKPAQMKEDE